MPRDLVLLIKRQRQIERDHQRGMPLLAQRGDERVIAETISAKHGARAGRYLHDIHFYWLIG